jgi:hypothetical protein
MRSERIVYTECQVTGEMGFVFKKLLNKNHGDITADTSGLLLAHDLIEHQNGLDSIGSVWDELEALGAVWFTRGECGQLGNGYFSPQQALASDLLNLSRFVNFKRIADKLKGYKKLRFNSYIKDDLLSVISELKKDSIESEIEVELTDKDFQTYKAYCLHHMIIGYRKANKRFNNNDIANHLFIEIKSKISKVLKFHDLYEGSEYSLSYDKSGNVYVKSINNFDY